MPRSLWNGVIAFQMVRVPVKLYTATESKSIHFHERHATDGSAIKHRRICVQEDREVPYAEIAKGFEIGSGRYVVLSKQEVAVADGIAAHVIDIEHFVSEREIDPVYYQRTYYLGPGMQGGRPYRLLHAALKRSDRVGIGRFVFHNKAQLVAIRALDEVMALHAMRFPDELDSRAPEIRAPERDPSKLEVDSARALIEQLQTRFQPSSYTDTYRDAVLELIERKARGEAIQVPSVEPATRDDDLLAALQESLNRPTRCRGSGADGQLARSTGNSGRASPPAVVRKRSRSDH